MKFNPESTIIVEGNEIVAKNDIYNSTYTGGVYVSGENNFGSEIIGNSSTNPSFFEFMDAHTKSTFGDDISYHIFRVASGQLDFNNLASNYLDIDLQVASATLNFNNVDFQNSNIYGVGNAIAVTGANTTTTFDGTISDAVTTLTDATLKFNSNTFENSDLIATSGNVDLSNDTVQEYLFNKLTSSADVKYVIDIDMTDTDNVKSDLFNVGMGSNGTITIDDIAFTPTLDPAVPTTEFNVQVLKAQDDKIELNLSDNLNVTVDVDLANGIIDKISGTVIGTPTGNINIDKFNYMSDSLRDRFSLNVANGTVKDYVTTSETSYMNKVYRYGIEYDKTSGSINFVGGGRDSSGYNPAVLAAPVATQLGGYLTLLQTYDNAFRNMDMYMLMTREQRQAMKLKNKLASMSNSIVYDPKVSQYENKAGWFRPYATFENVPLNSTRVSNVAYGSLFGGDSELYDLGHGWDGMFSVYAGYNGSHQAFEGVSIYQNGGMLGALGVAYKGNFFTGLSVNVGANSAEANTMYGIENFAMLMAGVASKTGYNWELAKGKFIIQPSFLMSYSFVNTFDYDNAAGLNIESDPLHAIQIEPGIKFILNLKNGWQPYAGVSMVWNILDRTYFRANDLALPNLAIDPFVKYGVGVRKAWGEKFTGYFQTYITNGGRNGVGLQTGFRWMLGKGS